MRVLVAGCGWLGTALGRALVARGERVTGVRRSAEASASLLRAGIEPWLADLSDRASIPEIPGDVEAIVACQSASDGSEAAYRAAYVETTRNLIEACRSLPIRAFVYTGSTGVFGQQDGSTVDETTPAAPAGPTAAILVEAERIVLDAAASGLPAKLVRLSGLYGPGRAGAIDRVRRGVLALGPGDETWMNWCHLDDAVATGIAAIDRGRTGAIYHATDANPARRREVVVWIAEKLGIEPPRVSSETALPGNRGGANRRISGERTREELGLALAYPSFREGLVPLLDPCP